MWQPDKQYRNEPGDADWGGHSRSAAPHTIPKMYSATYSEDTSRQEEHKQKRTLPVLILFFIEEYKRAVALLHVLVVASLFSACSLTT
jgi:hypothetical protein